MKLPLYTHDAPVTLPADAEARCYSCGAELASEDAQYGICIPCALEDAAEIEAERYADAR